MHLRNPGQAAILDTFPADLKSLCNADSGSDKGLSAAGFLSVSRIYIGDEFCPHRLPDVHALNCFFDVARETQSKLTLLTPFFTDKELERYEIIFDSLGHCPVEIEVVANDLGFIHHMKGRYPRLPLAVGRLLNRGFKDPRLPDTVIDQQAPEHERRFLRECTFHQPEFQSLINGLGICRVERDLLPYENGDACSVPGLPTSLYFPYGYFTTGRVCWISALNQPLHRRFALRTECAQPCSDVGFVSRDNGSLFRLGQNGNTFFYRYTSSQLCLLLRSARLEGLRLVYQGFAL